jgi:PAS domain S-box-containing protein
MITTKNVLENYKEIIRSDFFLEGPVIAFIWNNDTTWSVETVSQNIEKHLGYEDGLFLNNVLIYSSLIHPDDLNQVVKEVSEASIQKLKSFTHEPYRVLDKNDRYIWVKDSTTILYDEDENITHFVGYIISIDDEMEKNKKLNSELSFEASKLKALINTIPDLVWLKDKNGVYVSCNTRFEDFFGALENEIVGKTDYDFINKELADFFRENDNNAMHMNTPISNFEEIPFAKDGHIEYLKTTKSRVIDEFGELVGILGVGRDFTSERQIQKRLEEQKTELQTIFDTTKDGIAVLDMETNFKKVNKAYCEITGLSEEELLSSSCMALTYPEDIQNAQEQMKILLEKGFVESYEKRCFLKGKVLAVNISVNLLPDGKHMLLSMKDVSKFKIFEAQSKLASMGEMIGNIAHQWRQPLSVIAATSSGISLREEMGILDKSTLLVEMENITNQASYLSKTIDDFRNFIKDTHEQKELSVKETIEKTISIIHPAMKSHNIRLIVDIADDLEISGYENELIQSFINIINNGRDAIIENIENEEDRLIFISTVPSQKGFNVIIKDSGGGISQNVIDKIFEPYFTTKHQSVGTGIGLSMTYKILTERHNGTIDVFNEEYQYNGKNYKGATFRIVF